MKSPLIISYPTRAHGIIVTNQIQTRGAVQHAVQIAEVTQALLVLRTSHKRKLKEKDELEFFSYHLIVPSFEHSNKRHWSRGIQFTSQVKESSGKLRKKTQ